MGCASSNPLIDSGKKLISNVKESTSDFATKGEHVIEETAETAKEKIVSGVGNIKGAVGGVLEDAENSIESVVGKFGNTFNTLKNDANDDISELKDTSTHIKNNFVDNGMEVLSETETVLISETEHFKDEIHDIEDMAFEKINTEIENKEITELNDTLKLEDLEHEHAWDAAENETIHAGDKTKNVPDKASPSPEFDDKKEELPTDWEVKADAILEDRMKSFDKNSIDGSYEDTYFDFTKQEQDNEKEEAAEDHNIQNYNYSEQETELDDYQFNNIIVITEH